VVSIALILFGSRWDGTGGNLGGRKKLGMGLLLSPRKRGGGEEGLPRNWGVMEVDNPVGERTIMEKRRPPGRRWFSSDESEGARQWARTIRALIGVMDVVRGRADENHGTSYVRREESGRPLSSGGAWWRVARKSKGHRKEGGDIRRCRNRRNYTSKKRGGGYRRVQ